MPQTPSEHPTAMRGEPNSTLQLTIEVPTDSEGYPYLRDDAQAAQLMDQALYLLVTAASHLKKSVSISYNEKAPLRIVTHVHPNGAGDSTRAAD